MLSFLKGTQKRNSNQKSLLTICIFITLIEDAVRTILQKPECHKRVLYSLVAVYCGGQKGTSPDEKKTRRSVFISATHLENIPNEINN